MTPRCPCRPVAPAGGLAPAVAVALVPAEALVPTVAIAEILVLPVPAVAVSRRHEDTAERVVSDLSVLRTVADLVVAGDVRARVVDHFPVPPTSALLRLPCSAP